MKIKSDSSNWLFLLMIVLVFSASEAANAQSPIIPIQNRNYTVNNTILVPGKTTEAQLNWKFRAN
jgi:hypothetical protein